jgi:hypothetical protein
MGEYKVRTGLSPPAAYPSTMERDNAINWRHDQLNCIAVNQWNMVTCGNEMRRNVMFNEMLELE